MQRRRAERREVRELFELLTARLAGAARAPCMNAVSQTAESPLLLQLLGLVARHLS